MQHLCWYVFLKLITLYTIALVHECCYCIVATITVIIHDIPSTFQCLDSSSQLSLHLNKVKVMQYQLVT